MGGGRTGGRNMITLKTLHLATAQEVFDQVKTHLLTQRERSIDFNSCKYRSHNRLKCAAGCLIADDEYTMDMEGMTWISLVIDSVAPTNYSEMIRELQLVHDNFNHLEWEAKLKEIAKENKLEWNE